jgi:hypothetical protein
MVDHLTPALPEIQVLIVAPLRYLDAQCLGRANHYWADTWRSLVTNTRGSKLEAGWFRDCPAPETTHTPHVRWPVA